jgi:hypothetical protein
MTEKAKPSIVLIIKSDYLAYIGVLIPVIIFVMYIGFSFVDYLNVFREDKTIQWAESLSVFFYVFVVGFVVGVPLAIWRIRYIQKLFSNGIEVVGQITNISFYKDRGKFEYTYTYQGQVYFGNNAIMETEKTHRLLAYSQVVLLVNPDEPKHALIRDVYI